MNFNKFKFKLFDRISEKMIHDNYLFSTRKTRAYCKKQLSLYKILNRMHTYILFYLSLIIYIVRHSKKLHIEKV